MILCSPLMCDPQNKCYVKNVVHKNPKDGRRKYEAVAGIDFPHVRIATCSRSPCVTCTAPIMPRCRYGHRLNRIGIMWYLPPSVRLVVAISRGDVCVSDNGICCGDHRTIAT